MHSRGQRVLKERQKPGYSDQPISIVVSWGNQGRIATPRQMDRTTMEGDQVFIETRFRSEITATAPVAALVS